MLLEEYCCRGRAFLKTIYLEIGWPCFIIMRTLSIYLLEECCIIVGRAYLNLLVDALSLSLRCLKAHFSLLSCFPSPPSPIIFSPTTRPLFSAYNEVQQLRVLLANNFILSIAN